MGEAEELAALLRNRWDQAEKLALEAKGDLPGRWRLGSDPECEYVEVLGALNADAVPGDGYWHSLIGWDVGYREDQENAAREYTAVGEYIAVNDPEAVLAGIASQREMLDKIESTFAGMGWGLDLLKIWARPYTAVRGEQDRSTR